MIDRLSLGGGLLLALYAFTLCYAAVNYLLGEFVALLTLLIGFGLPIFAYLALEYIATPLIGCLAGFQARWSVLRALLLGYPLLVLAALVFPVGNTKKAMPVPVPWLAAYEASRDEVMSAMRERIVWLSALFLVLVAAGLASRAITGRLMLRSYAITVAGAFACPAIYALATVWELVLGSGKAGSGPLDAPLSQVAQLVPGFAPGHAWFVVGALVYTAFGAAAGLAIDVARAPKQV